MCYIDCKKYCYIIKMKLKYFFQKYSKKDNYIDFDENNQDVTVDYVILDEFE